MAYALTWDATGEKFYQNGVSQGVLYVQKSDGTYENGVVWNGLTSVEDNPDGGEANDLWADNIKYGSLRSAENHKGSINAYHYPDEFNACDGKVVTTDGIVIGQQARIPFGFCYRTEIGNDASPTAGYILHIVWNASISPSDKSYETINDNPDAIEFSWEYESVPVNVTSVTGVRTCCTMELNSIKLGTSKMAAAEAVLYGTAPSGHATLPTPDSLIATISAASGVTGET